MCINDHMNWLHSTTNDENKEDERERQRKRIKTHQTKKNVKNHKEKVLCAAANLCPDINALCVCVRDATNGHCSRISVSSVFICATSYGAPRERALYCMCLRARIMRVRRDGWFYIEIYGFSFCWVNLEVAAAVVAAARHSLLQPPDKRKYGNKWLPI